MKFMKLGSKPDAFRAEGNSIRYFPYRSVLLLECMPVENVANFCFCYLRRMMRKTFNFGLCYFEL
ncbi:unnamed protein product [Camellia sinensis]